MTTPAMPSLMMDTPLTVQLIMRHAERVFPDTEIVSVTADNPQHRTTYKDTFARTRQLANALAKLGLEQGDRVATLAWNDYRHLELYYATQCAGYVCHTINPRLFPEQVEYIVNHAEDKVIFVDKLVFPLVEKLAPTFKTVKTIVVMTSRAAMPETDLDVLCYEELIADEPDSYDWPDLDEKTACGLCYTSGTTGNPKGVLYNHRSTVIHAMAVNAAEAIGFRNRDVILPVVPMFHVNAWSVPYAALAVGSKLVFPGPKMGDGEALADMINNEQVTIALGVPTVWLGLLNHLQESGKTVDTLERTVVGGSACPAKIMDAFREQYDVDTIHAWGMTEMSPLGTLNQPPRGFDDWPEDKKAALRVKQGRQCFGVDMKIVDDDGKELPWDGEAFGSLLVRGPWICSNYFKLDDSKDHKDGWMDTGDVATIDEHGVMQITDRAKDVIKSGGEWISSIDLENVAMGHADVVEAAVIGVQHDKWQERPLLVIVPREGAQPDRDALIDYFDGKIAKWWTPDDVQFVDELPHTATGKISKLELRKRFEDYEWPEGV